MLEKLTVCPLGNECEKVVDGKIHVCAWLLDLKGIDPQTGNSVDKKQCAIVAQAMLIMDNTKVAYGQIQASSNLAEVILNGKKAANSSSNNLAKAILNEKAANSSSNNLAGVLLDGKEVGNSPKLITEH
jgi:hypothetical protein